MSLLAWLMLGARSGLAVFVVCELALVAVSALVESEPAVEEPASRGLREQRFAGAVGWRSGFGLERAAGDLVSDSGLGLFLLLVMGRLVRSVVRVVGHHCGPGVFLSLAVPGAGMLAWVEV